MNNSQSSSEGSDNCSSPSKKIKLSQEIIKHPGKFVGSGTSQTDVQNCFKNPTQIQRRSRVTPVKRLSKFSPVRFRKVLTPQKSSYSSNVPSNRNAVTKKLFLESEDEEIIDPLLEEEFGAEFSYRVRNFSNLLVEVLGDNTTFHLIDRSELNTISNFLNMPHHCKELYIQMYYRKHKWHFVSDLKYASNLSDIFNEIESYGFVTSDITSEDLDVILEFLNVQDLKLLCKEFKVKQGGGRKSDMTKILLNYATKQRTVAGNNMAFVLKQKITDLKGHSIKLCENTWKLFHRIGLLFALPISGDENVETVVQHNLMLMNYIEMGKMVYPTYSVVKTIPIFNTKEVLIKYEEAVQLQLILTEVVAKKNWDIVKEYVSETRNHFQNIIQDEEQNDHILKLPLYLRKFSAGSVYAQVLFLGVQGLKNDESFHTDAIAILKELLGQNIYLAHHRGFWHDQLISLLLKKRPLIAASSVVKAMEDAHLDEIQRIILSNRGYRLLARKKPLPKKIRQKLRDSIEELLEKPECITIEAESVRFNKQGLKLVYIQDDNENATTYCSVEELAITHYKKIGFSKGKHAEGMFVKTIFGLIFWDIIYEHTVPDVFQSRYQTQPLDLKYDEFYLNRKDVIDKRLEEMERWTVENIHTLIKSRYSEHEGKLSIVSWNWFSGFEQANELISCIGMHLLTLICERMSKSYQTACTGFPDLVLWAPGQREKCKFVEVKSQGDSLSPGQKLWMDYLINIGADAEVCIVLRTSKKNLGEKLGLSHVAKAKSKPIKKKQSQ